MKVKLLAVALATSTLFLASTSFANMPPKPAKCPGASAIPAVKFDAAQMNQQDGSWIVGTIHSKYDTKDTWTFALVGIQAKNESDARTLANKAVKSLSFIGGPIANDQYQVWGCLYQSQT